MPTFAEHSGAGRDSRSRSSKAPPLLSTEDIRDQGLETPEGKYDVVIVGAGPAGLFLTLLLARYGLPGSSVLCIDQKPGTLQTGQADGLQPRTLEVLHSLGLAHEILSEGCHMWEVGFWNAATKEKRGSGGIERTSYAADVVARARFPHEVTLHQGRIERILAEDLAKYVPQGGGVRHSTRFLDFQLDEASDSDFPLSIKIAPIPPKPEQAHQPLRPRVVRAKHIVAADGAHSAVRRAANLTLVGESRDHVWGVVDFVADTDFPDVRRRCAIHSNAGSAMVIPRERIATGAYLTRLYIQMDDVVDEGDAATNPSEGQEVKIGEKREKEGLDHEDGEKAREEERAKASAKKRKVSLETIFHQAERVFRPYHLRMAQGTEPDWWAAYQIGQRMTSAFTQTDSKGIPRVFVVGDAAHTHSPKAGQGMNVSLMDSYNLSWKLAYRLLDLSPDPKSLALLLTYPSERSDVARDLIDFDTRFSSMFSGKVGSNLGLDGEEGRPLTHERFLEVFSAGSGFSSGCGIEYAGSCAIEAAEDLGDFSWHSGPCSGQELQEALLQGALWPGRRLADVEVMRHADGNPQHLQDAFPSNGRFRILILAATSLFTTSSPSAIAIDLAAELVEATHPRSLLELVVIHPLSGIRGCEWSKLPRGLKRVAEMRFFCGKVGEGPVGKAGSRTNINGEGERIGEKWGAEDVYGVLAIEEETGAVAVVRPDGYVGCVAGLGSEAEGMERVKNYLERFVRFESET